MRNGTTYSFMSDRVRYTGTCEKGAYKGDPVVGYGFYCVNGRCYIYGHLTIEESKVCHWYRVVPDSAEFTVVTRADALLECSRKRARHRTEHLADYGSANEMP